MSQQRPFPAFPCIESFNPVGDIQPCLIRLCRSIDSFEPISAVFGPAGVGKTLMAKLLEQQYSPSHRVITIPDGAIQGRTDLLQHLVHSFERETEGRDEITLNFEFHDCVRSEGKEKRKVLLVVDDAQKLNEAAFEAIRSITDLMVDERPCVQSVLIGTQKLEDLLIGSCSESITQRIATRCYLHPLTEADTRAYVHATVDRFGADPEETICDRSLASVFHCTNGIPRLINQLMTEAIDVASERQAGSIDHETVESAWASLQQLPDPHEKTKESESTSEIEFGELSEFDAEPFGVPGDDHEAATSVEMKVDSTSCEETQRQTVMGQSDAVDSKPQQPFGRNLSAMTGEERPPLELPELDYPVVIQSDHLNSDSALIEDYPQDDCLESIIEEKLGVAESAGPLDVDSHGQLGMELMGAEGGAQETQSQVASIFEEESSELLEGDFDEDEERRALIALLDDGDGDNAVDANLEEVLGPVLDVNVVQKASDSVGRQKPSRVSRPDAESALGSKEPDDLLGNSENIPAVPDGLNRVDPPQTNPPSSKISQEQFDAMLQRLRASRGA